MNEELESNQEIKNDTNQQNNQTITNLPFNDISQSFSNSKLLAYRISKTLPFFIFIFSLKCLMTSIPDSIEYHLGDIISNKILVETNHCIFRGKALRFFLFLQMIIYHISVLFVNHSHDKSEILFHKLWINPHLHHLLYLIVSQFYDVQCRFFFLQYVLIYFHESVRVFDIDLLTRSKDIQIQMHKYNQIILCSIYYQRLRAIIELLWLPYLVGWSLFTFELESILFLYFYFFIVFLYSVRYDQFHQWIWLIIDSYCTKFAYQSKEPYKQILLKFLFLIRRFGSLSKRIYPDIDK